MRGEEERSLSEGKVGVQVQGEERTREVGRDYGEGKGGRSCNYEGEKQWGGVSGEEEDRSGRGKRQK